MNVELVKEELKKEKDGSVNTEHGGTVFKSQSYMICMSTRAGKLSG